MKRCPFYNSTDACVIHSDCLFLRNGGCAIVLSATIADDLKREFDSFKTRFQNLEYRIEQIARKLNT